MRAQLQPVLDDTWWRRVTPERIGTAYESAQGWAEHDDLARAVADRIRAEVQQRYGIDIDDLARNAAVVRTDLEIAATKSLNELTTEQRRLSYLDAQRWLAHDNPELSEFRGPHSPPSIPLSRGGSPRRLLGGRLRGRGGR